HEQDAQFGGRAAGTGPAAAATRPFRRRLAHPHPPRQLSRTAGGGGRGDAIPPRGDFDPPPPFRQSPPSPGRRPAAPTRQSPLPLPDGDSPRRRRGEPTGTGRRPLSPFVGTGPGAAALPVRLRPRRPAPGEDRRRVGVSAPRTTTGARRPGRARQGDEG